MHMEMNSFECLGDGYFSTHRERANLDVILVRFRVIWAFSIRLDVDGLCTRQQKPLR
jgi:hypothetical protein